MKRGTAAKVILGKDTLMDVPAGIVHGTDVILGGKAGLLNDFGGLVLSNNLMIGKKVSRGTITTVTVRGQSPLVLPDAIAGSLQAVKAFGGIEQQNIPQPYTQVNYVTNTVRTAVDTGIMIDFAKNYEFEVECRAVSGSWYILQSRASSAGNITGISGANSGSTIILAVGNVTACTSAITRTVGNKLYVKATLNAGIATLYVKDETAGTEDTQTGSYGPTQPNPTAAVYLLGNAGGNYVDVNSDIYMVRIKENGVTVMDYVPARQVATAGFYDTVSGTFKTALTPANLSADGETVPTPDAPMDIVSNNGALEFQDSELPSEYRRLLGYACDNDVLWQITDFHLRGSDTIRISFSVTAACNVFGCYQGADATDNYDLYVSTSSGGRYLRYGDGTYLSYWSSANLGQRFDVVFTPTGTTGMPQDSTWTQMTFESANDLLLAATTLTGSSSKLRGNLYGSFVVDGRLNLIPCERVIDGSLGYYDTYTGTFYEPTGTPTSLGYDFSYYSIKTSGTVETIQVHGTNVFNKNATDALMIGFPAADGKWNATAGFAAICCKLLEGKTYTITRVTSNPTSSAMRVIAYDKVPTANYYGTPLFIGTNTTKTATITVPTGSPYIVTYVKHSADSITDQDLLDGFHIEFGETALDYQPYFNGGTATTEILLKLSNKSGDTIYAQDVQNVTTGEITRNVGVRVFVGTETWTMGTNQDASNNRVFYTTIEDRKIQDTNMGLLCTHFNFKGTVEYSTLTTGEFCINQSIKSVYFDGNGITTLSDWKQWLADQATAGTPLIVIYPLETPTTESVTGQPLQVQAGDNYLEITQASLDGLELEATYKSLVQLTIEEVEDANLNNNVEVTIS